MMNISQAFYNLQNDKNMFKEVENTTTSNSPPLFLKNQTSSSILGSAPAISTRYSASTT